MRTSTLLTTSAAVLISCLLLAPAAQSAAPVFSGILTIAGSVGNAGRHLTAGAYVQLYAWPPDHTLQALRPGQNVPRKLLAAATTNSAGTYTLHVPAGALRSVADSSGYVNLEADSGAGSWFSFTFGASRLLCGTNGVPPSAAQLVAKR